MINIIVCCIGAAAIMFAVGFMVGMKVAEGRYDD